MQTHAIKTKLFFHKKAFLVASKNQKVLVEKREFSELSLPPVSVRAAVREANSENGAGRDFRSVHRFVDGPYRIYICP